MAGQSWYIPQNEKGRLGTDRPTHTPKAKPKAVKSKWMLVIRKKGENSA